MSKAISIFIAVFAHCVFGMFFKDSLDFPKTCMMGVIGLHLCRFSEEEERNRQSIWWLDVWLVFLFLAEVKVFFIMTIIEAVLWLTLSIVFPVRAVKLIINCMAFYYFVSNMHRHIQDRKGIVFSALTSPAKIFKLQLLCTTLLKRTPIKISHQRRITRTRLHF